MLSKEPRGFLKAAFALELLEEGGVSLAHRSWNAFSGPTEARAGTRAELGRLPGARGCGSRSGVMSMWGRVGVSGSGTLVVNKGESRAVVEIEFKMARSCGFGRGDWQRPSRFAPPSETVLSCRSNTFRREIGGLVGRAAGSSGRATGSSDRFGRKRADPIDSAAQRRAIAIPTTGSTGSRGRSRLRKRRSRQKDGKKVHHSECRIGRTAPRQKVY